MFEVLALMMSAMTLTFGIPLEQTSDDSVLSSMNFGEMANLIMSSHIEHKDSNTSEEPKPLHSSHLIEASKDLSLGAVLIPVKTMAEASAIGSTITSGAALKGSLKGSAIATPIILKAVALPGLAAGATAAIMSAPKLVLNNVPQLIFHNIKTSVEDSTHDLAHLFIVQDLKSTETPQTESDDILDLKGIENMAQTMGFLKEGALGLATKGLVIAKKGAVVAGRVILKPIAILTGVHLKMFGSGLAFGGKLIGGTGAGIAKAGTVVKYAGLGGIGLGASAIGWGLDKSTIDTHIEKSQ